MTATAEKSAAGTAAKVPVYSLPQTELLTVNVDDLPLLTDALGPEVDFKPLMLDPEIGLWVVLGTFAPGVRLPIHLHTGPVHGYTLSGEWIYEEYSDQPQTAGSYLYEPASSVHTFAVPETATVPAVVLFIINGANVSFTDEGVFHSVLDAVTVMNLVLQAEERQGLDPVNYLSGGTAKFRNS